MESMLDLACLRTAIPGICRPLRLAVLLRNLRPRSSWMGIMIPFILRMRGNLGTIRYATAKGA